MSRQTTVTAEQVNAAAATLKAAGSKISARAVRQQLGDVGSLGTIAKLLLRRTAGQERAPSLVHEVPAALQRAMLDFVDAELGAARDSFDSDLAEQHQEVTDLATENEIQLEAIETQGNELATLKDELAKERQVAEQARTELARAQLRLEGLPRLEEAAEKARMELAKAQFKLEDIPRLEEVAEQARAELVKMQVRLEAMARLETELAATRGELEAERGEMAELRVELEEERVMRIKAQMFEVDPIFKTRKAGAAPVVDVANSAAIIAGNARLELPQE